jgi:hypothetical protein
MARKERIRCRRIGRRASLILPSGAIVPLVLALILAASAGSPSAANNARIAGDGQWVTT